MAMIPSDRPTLLMVAFHFPPALGSGVQRTLSFCRDLPDFGWQPEVLTAHPRVFPRKSSGQINDIPSQLTVQRAFALDAAKDLAVAGRYLQQTASPDRWASWRLWAVPKGMAMIRRHRPQAIWATYPITTSLLIAHTLHKKSGIPWIADFRDPLVYDPDPDDPVMSEVYAAIEKKCVESCHKAIVTTQGHRHLFQQKYPHLPDDRWQVIPNGYDAAICTEVENGAACPQGGGQITLLHSGTLYTGPDERDPRPFFAVLARLLKAGRIHPTTLHILFRATSHDQEIQGMIAAAGLTELVTIKPPLSYREALEEMFQVDGLLLFQGGFYKHQVPAKLFEYFRAKRPILALVDPEGDTAQLMREAGVTTLAPLRGEEEIEKQLLRVLQSIQTRQPILTDPEQLMRFSRYARAGELAEVLDQIHPS
ncbi:MAG: glycosyltransferase [Magnetococcales bacterium]|nr:glycosyltransferase [Magnetococcales bacterium]